MSGGFSSTFAEEILVYYILADLEIKFVTFGGQIFSNQIRLCIYFLSKQARRNAELMQSFQRPSYRKNVLIENKV